MTGMDVSFMAEADYSRSREARLRLLSEMKSRPYPFWKQYIKQSADETNYDNNRKNSHIPPDRDYCEWPGSQDFEPIRKLHADKLFHTFIASQLPEELLLI